MAGTDYHANVLKVSSTVHGFFHKAFSAVHVEGTGLEMETLNRNPTMVACTHRSQTDYFLLGSVLSVNGLRNLRFAAGDNLTELPILGKKFLDWGAFTVKRRANLARGYIRELCDQVVSMLRNGDSIIVFPEGGRSYKGEMMDLKGGIVAAAILTQVRQPDRDVMILPAAISYEQLPELLWFDVLGRGKALRKDGKGPLTKLWGSVLYFGADIFAFARFLCAYRFGVRYGEVFIDHDPPVRLRDLVDLSATVIENARDDFSAHRTSMQVLGDRLFERFKALYRILPMHVLAAVIRDNNVTTIEQAEAPCAAIIERLRGQGRNLKSVECMSIRDVVERGARQLQRMKGIRRRGAAFTVFKSWIIRYYAETV